MDLVPFALLGGKTAADLFPLLNGVIPAWIALAVAPEWSTKSKTILAIPLVHAAIYAGALFSLQLDPGTASKGGDFVSLEGVARLFQDPNVVFIGWTHYIVFDLLVARTMVADALKRKIPKSKYYAVVVPCLAATLLYGPAGWLLYQTIASTGFLDGQG